MNDDLAPPPAQSEPPNQDNAKTAPPPNRTERDEAEAADVLRV